MTYEVRSKFVITSLRPAFAKIYPSTRPDLAVETFFHARPGSPLLRGITDDDFITWFDKTELASLKTSASIDNICECGRICSRDYEFRKSYEKHTDSTTESTTEITTDSTTEMTTDSTTLSTTENVDTSTITESTVAITELSTTEATATNKPSSSTSTTDVVSTQETTMIEENLSENDTTKIERIDDPIIIPTVTYLNNTGSQIINNNIRPLMPKINGELIVQKSALPKVPKKDEIKKKPLPRRKGTLKATYGEKHEKFFLKLKEIETTVSAPITTSTEERKVIISKTKENTHDKPTSTNQEMEKSMHKVILKETDVAKPLLPVHMVVNQSHIIKIEMVNKSSVVNITKENNDSLENKTTNIQIVYNDTTTANPFKTVMPVAFLHSEAAMPHTITAITNNNIKSIHYRTKKPKAQIKKPLINAIHNATKYNKSEDIASDIINKTKKKTMIPQKYNSKTMKSINKEIHKIPPTPISETSKTLSEALKYDIAPENKGGFEILDKNNLWELLKEGSDNDPSKIEEKLHVHNRLNMLGHNMSNVDDKRSL